MDITPFYLTINKIRVIIALEVIIMLDKHSIEILKFIQCNETTSIEQINNKFTTNYNNQKSVDFLCEIQYIKGLTPKYKYAPGFHKIDEIKLQVVYDSPYEITPKGIAYLELLNTENKEKKSQTRQNILINFGCLILGFILEKIPSFITWLIALLNQ